MAPDEEIKHAFRREIARYHPDKVHHLGPEFQEIAATRAAELTEAYRVLSDARTRRKYDQSLLDTPARTAIDRAGSAPAGAGVWRGIADAGPQRDRTAAYDVIRKAAVAKLRDAVATLDGAVRAVAVPGFDEAYIIKPSRLFFRKPTPQVKVLVRFVPEANGAAVLDAWPLALRSGGADGLVCLLLLGAGLGPAGELGAAVAELRRKTRTAAPILVPVNVWDWGALFPPDAPDVIRQILQRLKAGA
jgi:hypothetical protein